MTSCIRHEEEEEAKYFYVMTIIYIFSSMGPVIVVYNML